MPIGYNHRPLGNCRRAFEVRVGLLPRHCSGIPEILHGRIHQAGKTSRHPGKQACLRHGHHGRARRGTHAIGKPIVYTSADSVIQIAAHEEIFGLQHLYDICKIARELSYELNIGRVIARPFVGTAPENFKRTGNRKDFAVLPPSPTLLDVLTKAGRDVVSIGKIGDIYAHSGTGREIKVAGNELLFQTTLENMDRLKDGGFLMTNFVDFDMEYGHRRDVQGYGAALERFDALLPQIFAKLRQGDLLIITADHGNDPTWKGTDHTRERIPVLAYATDMKSGSIGRPRNLR